MTDDNDYQRYQAADARQVGARVGLELEIAFAENNAVLQIQQLFRSIHAPVEHRPIAIIVEPVALDGIERVARNAAESGIGFVLINTQAGFMAALAQRYRRVPVATVRIDQVEVGRIQGRQFRALLPAGGRLLYVQGPPHNNVAKERAIGMAEVVHGAPIEMTSIHGLWTADSAERALRSFWRLKTAERVRPDLIGSQNDAMVEGLRQAASSHPDATERDFWSRVPCTGVDGLQDGGRRMVDRGDLLATIIGPSNAGPALDLVARFQRGEPIPAEVVQRADSYPTVEELARRRGGPIRVNEHADRR